MTVELLDWDHVFACTLFYCYVSGTVYSTVRGKKCTFTVVGHTFVISSLDLVGYFFVHRNTDVFYSNTNGFKFSQEKKTKIIHFCNKRKFLKQQ